MNGEKSFVLFPCSGRARLTIPRGHVYAVKEVSSGKEIGFITEQVAKEKYGENYRISQSDSLCPLCAADIDGIPEIKLIE